MNQSVYQKLEVLVERFEEVQALLSDPETISVQNKFRTLSKELKQLKSAILQYLINPATVEDAIVATLKPVNVEDIEMLKLFTIRNARQKVWAGGQI